MCFFKKNALKLHSFILCHVVCKYVGTRVLQYTRGGKRIIYGSSAIWASDIELRSLDLTVVSIY